MDQWTPKTTGAGFEMSPILKPLAPFKNHLTVVSKASKTNGPPVRCTHLRPERG